MSHALVTVVAPLAPDRVAAAEAAIERLGNPAEPRLRGALDRLDGDGAGTHFASLHAIRSVDGERAYLVFDLSADGTPERALARIVEAIGDALRPILGLASDWREGDLAAYMLAHRVEVGGGYLDNPGLAFAGTPGLSVGRIRGEAALALAVSDLLNQQGGDMEALERVEDVRRQLDPRFAGMLAPGEAGPFDRRLPVAALIARLLASFAVTYLWPVALIVVAWSLFAGLLGAWLHDGFWEKAAAFLIGALAGLWSGFWVALLVVAVVLVLGYLLLRRAEARDFVDERAPDHATVAAIFARENRCAQNHMISATQRKPGLLRALTSRLVFWATGEFAVRAFRPGFLGSIGTIHFACWITPPRSPDLIFLSNYDMSWESYLEDFITRLNEGLTGIWSNSIGFPRSRNLVQGGAADGERFKRYARRSMLPTRFWYSAYPDLTTTAIRVNAEMRRGLSGAMTEDEAARLLALFGSAARPASKLVGNEIQSLAFGGLIFLPFGTCLIFDLPEDAATARTWLQGVRPHIAFNDGRRLGAEAIVILALGPRGLARLGLPPETLNTFPFAFLEGMTTEARARILGDTGANASEHWRWGRTPPDAALLVYGATQEAATALEQALVAAAQALGMAPPHRIPLKEVSRTEPFGFADGISQPVIRGTYKALRTGDPIQVVEPGEFVLGYPDNRGNVPPGPTMPATADPHGHLPLVGAPDGFQRSVVESLRDVGCNGSFLAIRELEQDVAAFWNYCDTQSWRLSDSGRLPPPYVPTREFVAAKLVGRWPDGSSLVRHPYEPPPRERRRSEGRPGGLPRKMSMMRKEAVPDGADTTRLKTSPAKKSGIEPAPTAENDFLFGTEDPEALRCPFGAHVRRANPRDSFDPGSANQIAISNRHRIMRVGRQYQPEAGRNPGILFMCLNGDLERQFEFVQQTWLKSPSFHGLSCEKDPILGDAEAGACSHTIPTREGPVRLTALPRFVTTRGGGYFFMPGKRLLDYLGAPPVVPGA